MPPDSLRSWIFLISQKIKIVSGETVKEVAEVLTFFHLPVQMNFKTKFGIEEAAPELEAAVIEEPFIEPESKAEEIYQPEGSSSQPQKSWSRSKFFCAK